MFEHSSVSYVFVAFIYIRKYVWVHREFLTFIEKWTNTITQYNTVLLSDMLNNSLFIN